MSTVAYLPRMGKRQCLLAQALALPSTYSAALVHVARFVPLSLSLLRARICSLSHGRTQSRRKFSNFSSEFQRSRNVLRFFCSAVLTSSQRAQASGSINSLIAFSTHSRRALGSIASSSQHWLPYLPVN